MDIVSKINGIELKMSKSPIRRSIEDKTIFPIEFNADKKIRLNDLYNELLIQKEKLLKPLNIVLMGEVKAGKSTLINSLVGDDISPTDVLEATSVIIEVSFGRIEKAIIFYKDGNKKEGSIDDIFKFIKVNQTDVGFADSIEVVKVMKNKEGYKHYNLVDTPGLLTITNRNAELSKDYIKWADIVLWIMDANYLGQSDIIQEIEAIEEYGKPIICILNKIDKIQGDAQKVIDYAEDKYSLYFKDIIPLSAKDARLSVLNYDNELKKNSGFEYLTEYLRDYTLNSKSSEEVKLDSIEKTLNSIVDRERFYHKEILDELKEIVDTYYEIEDHMNYYCNKINGKVELSIKSRVKSEFIKEEADNIMDFLNNKGSSKKNTKQLEDLFEDLTNEENLPKYIGVLQEQIEDILNQEWTITSQKLENKINGKITRFVEEQQRSRERMRQKLILNGINSEESESNIFVNEDGTIMGFNLESIKEGALISGGAGVVLAFYESVLGPAAASVTLGSALSAIVPPMALAGVVIMGFKSILDKNKKNENLKSEILRGVELARERFNLDVVDAYIMPKVREDNEIFVSNTLDDYKKMVLRNFDIGSINMIIKELEDYC